MAKQYKIRWTNSDTRELGRAVRKFNTKIARLAKQNPSIENILPERVTSKELKEIILTRSDLKREINALERFSKKGAETLVKAPKTSNNVYTTKWQKEELTRRVAIVNRKRKARLKELSKLPAKSRGQELGYTVGQAKEYIGMGRAEEVSLLPMSAFTSSMSGTEIKKKYKSARFQSQTYYYNIKDLRLRDNFIKGITESYNPEDVADVIAAIENMSIEDFIEKFYEEGATMEYASPGKLTDLKLFEYQGYLEGLKSAWIPGYISTAENMPEF